MCVWRGGGKRVCLFVCFFCLFVCLFDLLKMQSLPGSFSTQTRSIKNIAPPFHLAYHATPSPALHSSRIVGMKQTDRRFGSKIAQAKDKMLKPCATLRQFVLVSGETRQREACRYFSLIACLPQNGAQLETSKSCKGREGRGEGGAF